MRPTAIVELGIKKNRLAIEMRHYRGIHLACIQHLQDRNHRLGRLEPSYVDVNRICGLPDTRSFARFGTMSHDKTPPAMLIWYQNTGLGI